MGELYIHKQGDSIGNMHDLIEKDEVFCLGRIWILLWEDMDFIVKKHAILQNMTHFDSQKKDFTCTR